MDTYPQAIVWDLDGTLIDSAPDLADSLGRLLREQGRPALDENQVRRMIGNGVEKLIAQAFAVVDVTIPDRQMSHLVSRFLSIYSANATRRTRLYADADTVLRHFHAAGVRQGICTNKPEAIAKQILADLSVVDIFDIIVGGDTTAAKKPDPLPLQKCIEALSVKPAACVLIGDSRVDVETARAVDMSVGIVSFGYAREPLEDIGADFFIDDLASLPASLGGFRHAS